MDCMNQVHFLFYFKISRIIYLLNQAKKMYTNNNFYAVHLFTTIN